jgi:hypothetical protein
MALSKSDKITPFEIQKNNIGGIAAHDGNSKLELDAHKNSGAEQEVTGLEAGKSYKLSVYYTPRALNRANSNSVEIIIDGQNLLTLNSPTKAWAKYDVSFTATGTTAKIQILGSGTSDSYGGLIDSVSLVEENLASAPNLITNGSFEDGYTVTDHSGQWQVFESIPGWSAYLSEPVTGRIEVQNGPTIGGIAAAEGSAKVELDAHNNTMMYQDITTETLKKYVIRYSYSPRVNGNAETNKAGVFWNGERIIDLNGTTKGWAEFTHVVDAGELDTTRLEFHGEGTSDSLGAYIDGVSVREVNCQVPSSISFIPDAKDLNTSVASFDSYTATSDSAIMLYRVDKIKSPKKIKSIKWTYGDRSFTGSAFRTYASTDIGDSVSVEVEDVDGFKASKTLSLTFEDECFNSENNSQYGFCLKSNDYERDGNYVNPLNGSLSFYLSHGDSLEGNISDITVLLTSEDNKDEFDVTAATTLQGQNLILNTLALSSLNIDLNKKFYITLDGEYANISAPFQAETNTARTKNFKIGFSNLNIAASESITELAIVSVDGEFGTSMQQNFGTTYSLSNIPAGVYTVHAKNDTSEGYASFKLSPGAVINLAFNMQPIDIYNPARQALIDSYIISEGVQSLARSQSVSSFSTVVNNPVNRKPNNTVYIGDNSQTLTCSGLASKPNPYKLARFQNNFDILKNKFIGADVTQIPEPVASISVNRVNGFLSGYTVVPDRIEDKGLANQGIPVEAGKSYISLMFGEHPLLFEARSKFHADFNFNCCSKNADGAEALSECRRTRDYVDVVWAAFRDNFEHFVVDVLYTVSGKVNRGLIQEEKHLMTFSSSDFVAENGGADAATLEWIFSSEIGDGWLLQQPKTIEIPGYFEDPRVSVELLTRFPDEVTGGYSILEQENFWMYFSAGLIKDERLPSIKDYKASSGSYISSSKKTASAHGKLLLDKEIGLFPIVKEQPSCAPEDIRCIYNFYRIQAGETTFDVTMDIETTDLDRFEVTGVWGHLYFDGSKFPSSEKGILIDGTRLIKKSETEYTINFNTDDFFENQIPFGLNPGVHSNLRMELGLVMRDTEDLQKPDSFGPINKTVKFSPSYNLARQDLIDYTKKHVGYSKPNGAYAKRDLANYFKVLVDSDLNNENAATSKVKYNDGSLPFGGKFNLHGSHRDGLHLDVRYPTSQSNTWDQTFYSNGEFDTDKESPEDDNTIDINFCSSAIIRDDEKAYHGYKKYLAMKNYSWIKYLAKRIDTDLHAFFPEPYLSQSLSSQDHNGSLVKFIAETVCKKSEQALNQDCLNLAKVYSSANLINIDNFVAHVVEIRSGVDRFSDLDSNNKVDRYLISKGGKLTQCYPPGYKSIDWHEKMLSLGQFPDGISAGIGTWSNTKVPNYRNDVEHLSHIHIQMRK